MRSQNHALHFDSDPDSEVRYWEGVAPKGKYVAPVPVPTSPSGRVPVQSGVAGE